MTEKDLEGKKIVEMSANVELDIAAAIKSAILNETTAEELNND